MVRFVRAISVAAILLLPDPGTAGNIAHWTQSNPDYKPRKSPARPRDDWAVWPSDLARDLRYYIEFDAPTAMRKRLRGVIRNALDVWESAADVKFRPARDSASANIVIHVKHDGKSGPVYHGGGDGWPPWRDTKGRLMQASVHLAYRGDPNGATDWRDDCWVWTAVHELGHALGLWHEFQRPDRDKYVRVDPDPARMPFIPHEAGDTAGTPFDFASVMMYAWTDGDRGGRFFFVAPQTGQPLPTVDYYQRNGLSPGDAATIQLMYGRPQKPGVKPILHVPPVRTDAPLQRLQEAGWRIVAHPGADVYGVGDAVTFEAEKGLWDHWVDGGNPPRVTRIIGDNAFELSVDVDARYVPPGSCAGLFIVLGPRDWVTFGARESPRSIAVQRTGQNWSKAVVVAESRYRLIASCRDGVVRFACECGGKRHAIEPLIGLPRPTELAFGVRSWSGAEFEYRCVRIRGLAYLALKPE